MKPFVLDCSVTMSWCFEDETDDYATRVLDMLAASEAVVPCLWPLEVANVLLVGERRGRLTEAESTRFLSLLQTLPILIDETSTAATMSSIIALGRQHNVSSYDAAYLELAMRQGFQLATLDEDLRKTAAALGVSIVTVGDK